MKNRREFIKTAATGAVLAGFARRQAGIGRHAGPGTRRRASPRSWWRAMRRSWPSGQLDEKRVQALLDRAIATYTGRDNPVEAWKHIVPVGKVIGLKVNGLGGKGISTHAALVMAVCERLQQAGVKPGRHYRLGSQRTRSPGLRADHLHRCPAAFACLRQRSWPAYEEQPVVWFGSECEARQDSYPRCDMVIGLPILKDHEMAGVTFAMKNMYGVVTVPGTARHQLQSRRGRSELHPRYPRESALHHWRRHDFGL